MSDTSQGPGWWQASDGKWYSPAQAPGAQVVQPPGAQGVQPPGAPGFGPPAGATQWNQPAPKKSHTTRNVLITLGVVAFLLIGGCTALLFAGGAAIEDAAESIDLTTTTVTSVASSGSNTKPSDATPAEPTFVDGVLTTSEISIRITDKRVIAVGAPGNEYGDKPVIAFWYDITNLTDGDVSPMNWIYVFSAFQDNNPNAINELEIASLPDDRFLESQTEQIKKGGTVQNAVAYELDDQTTPVDLVASSGLGRTEIGRTTYPIG